MKLELGKTSMAVATVAKTFNLSLWEMAPIAGRSAAYFPKTLMYIWRNLGVTDDAEGIWK